MPYTRPYAGGFVNFPTTTTPIDATALNTMDVGIQTSNDQFQTVTTTQRTALSPTVGQAVWDSDLRQLMVFMNAAGGNAWQPVGNTIVCASTTRPSVPFEGQEIYETDTNQKLIYDGSSWIETGDLDNTNGVPSGLAPLFAAWTVWTPTYSNITVGNATVTAKYLKVGRMVTGGIHIQFGSTSAVTGDAFITLPVPAASGALVAATAHYYNPTGTTAGWALGAYEISGSNLYLRAPLATGTYLGFASLSATIPGTWQTNSQIRVQFTYESAS